MTHPKCLPLPLPHWESSEGSGCIRKFCGRFLWWWWWWCESEEEIKMWIWGAKKCEWCTGSKRASKTLLGSLWGTHRASSDLQSTCSREQMAFSQGQEPMQVKLTPNPAVSPSPSCAGDLEQRWHPTGPPAVGTASGAQGRKKNSRGGWTSSQHCLHSGLHWATE